MFVTTGDIASIFAWFESKYNQMKFLCLLVAGDLNDAKFFKDVFDNKEALDVITGKQIAFFLFANGQEDSLHFEVSGGRAEVLPGEILIPQSIKDISGFWHYHISKIFKDDLRENIIKRSQIISYELCDYFNLGLNDIPCILLILKGEQEPMIIRTKGETDIKAFFNFLKDLREIADSIPYLSDFYEPLNFLKGVLSKQKRIEEEKILRKIENKFKKALEKCYDLLKKFGMPPDISRLLINSFTAKNIWEIVGLRTDIPQPDFALPYNKIIKDALDNGNLKERCREIAKLEKELAHKKRHLKKHDRGVNEIQFWARKNSKKLNYDTRKMVKDICDKYEQKFKWRSRFRPLRNFANAFIGINKNINDILSVQEKIKKIIS